MSWVNCVRQVSHHLQLSLLRSTFTRKSHWDKWVCLPHPLGEKCNTCSQLSILDYRGQRGKPGAVNSKARKDHQAETSTPAKASFHPSEINKTAMNVRNYLGDARKRQVCSFLRLDLPSGKAVDPMAGCLEKQPSESVLATALNLRTKVLAKAIKITWT